MATILPFSTERRRRNRPARRGGDLRGEIVIFSGVRIDRSGTDRLDAPPKAAQPKPGRGRLNDSA